MKSTIYNLALVFCLLVGPIQVIGGLTRLAKVKYPSDYSKGLNRYFSAVVGYILLFFITTLIHNSLIDVERIGIIFLPIIPICIALYYWRVIYNYNRTEIK